MSEEVKLGGDMKLKEKLELYGLISLFVLLFTLGNSLKNLY